MMNKVEIFIGIIAFQIFLVSSLACNKGHIHKGGLRSIKGTLRDDGKKTIVKSSLIFKGLPSWSKLDSSVKLYDILCIYRKKDNRRAKGRCAIERRISSARLQ